jgi:hypothetical protein
MRPGKKGRGWVERPYLSARLLTKTYVEVNDPVRLGGLSFGDNDDIVHFSTYRIS